mgnify:CR=1 FL=1
MPKSWLKSPIDGLETLLANAAGFRTFVAAGSIALARNSIYPFETAQRPVAISAVTTGGAGAGEFKAAGDFTALAKENSTLRVIESTGNDGTYTLRGVATLAAGVTTFPVAEAVGDSTVDGELQLQWMPRAVIGSAGGREHVKQSSGGWISSGGQLWVSFEWETPATYWDPASEIDDPSGAGLAFLALIETIVDDLQDLQQAGGGLLNVHAFSEITPGPLEGDPDENYGVPFWHVSLGLAVGAPGGG